VHQVLFKISQGQLTEAIYDEIRLSYVTCIAGTVHTAHAHVALPVLSEVGVPEVAIDTPA